MYNRSVASVILRVHFCGYILGTAGRWVLWCVVRIGRAISILYGRAEASPNGAYGRRGGGDAYGFVHNNNNNNNIIYDYYSALLLYCTIHDIRVRLHRAAVVQGTFPNVRRARGRSPARVDLSRAGDSRSLPAPLLLLHGSFPLAGLASSPSEV